jgi:tetratricopeptide (TPR) repeat protein
LLTAAPSPVARAAFDRGEQALAANRLDDAVGAYKEALTATPGYPDALTGLGSAYFKQGKRDEAVAQFQAAIAADSNFKLAYFNLGWASRKMGDFTTAATAYENYTKREPNDPDGWYGLGDSYRQSGQAQKAIKAFTTFLGKEKRPSEQKWVDKAKGYIADLNVQNAPGASPAASAPATAPSTTAPPPPQPKPAPAPQITQAQPQSALPTATATAAPSLAQRKLAEGDKAFADKRYREASFAYQDASNADPHSVEALFKLGNAYAILGYFAQAVDRWHRVIELSPDPSVRKSAQENIDKAQQKIAAAGGSSPQGAGKAPGTGPLADTTRQQARKAYEQGVQQINSRDYSNAVQSLSQAIQLEPTLTVAYVARGSANIGMRRYAEAAVDYQYAIRLDPNMASPVYGLAEAYRAMGRPADARQYYDRYVASTATDVRADLQADARQKADKLR